MMAPALSVENLSIHFPSRSGDIAVVDDVSFDLDVGRSLVIVGESGSGKSMICQTLLGITPATARISGRRIGWCGRNLLEMLEEDWRSIRGSEIAMIFQDSAAALNPLFTVGRQICDVIRTHRHDDRKKVHARAIEVLKLAGFPEPTQRMKNYPSQLSGGLRQRVAIAMALSCSPSLIIADEATTNLDVSIQAQIIKLLCELKMNLGLALIFVTHDLGLASEIGDDLLVMYAGHAVEYGSVQKILSDPCHPYTRGLLRSAPTLRSSRRVDLLTPIPGQTPKPGSIGKGSPFRFRCPVAISGLCEESRPDWTEISPDHRVACHRFTQDGGEGMR